MTRRVKVMLVAGEASGDALGAGLIRALRRRLGASLSVCGVGGAQMAAEGVDSPFDIAELSIFGFIDALLAAPRVKRRIAETVEQAVREQPDVAVLIDSWGFTIRLAQALRWRLPNLKLVKYVAPQVWASRPGRAAVLAGSVDHLLATQSMDPPWFEKAGLPTTFVGNPALAIDMSGADGARFRREIGAGADDPVVLVLPGSRPSEVKRLRGPFGEAMALLRASHPDVRFAVVAAPTVRDAVLGWVASLPVPAAVIEGDGAKHDAMKGSTVALACSGTVSTELALAGAPMVIAYRLGPVTYEIVTRIVTARYATLFNLAANEEIAPELLQADCTPRKLADEVARRLDDPTLREDQIARQSAALALMGSGRGDPSEAAADVLIRLLDGQ